MRRGKAFFCIPAWLIPLFGVWRRNEQFVFGESRGRLSHSRDLLLVYFPSLGGAVREGFWVGAYNDVQGKDDSGSDCQVRSPLGTP